MRFLVSLIFFMSCIQFRVEEMKSQLVTRLKLGQGLNKIEFEKVGNSLLNIPLKIPITSDRVFVVDYKNALLKVFLLNGNLDYIVGTTKDITQTTKVLSFKLSNPGLISVSEDDEIYLQDRVSLNLETKLEERNFENITSGFFVIREPVYLPSYILNINASKKNIEVIGISGKNTEPFQYIEAIVAGEKGKLFVVHRQSLALELIYFFNGKKKAYINENELSIFNSEEAQKYNINLELIIPDKAGNYALLMFSFIGKNDERFKFRRIYRYKYNQPEPEKLLKEFQNPSEVLFAVLSNKNFITWETESNGNSIKLLFHDSNGNHILNKRISLDEPRVKWRETYMDYRDTLFSIKIESGYLELYKWN